MVERMGRQSSLYGCLSVFCGESVNHSTDIAEHCTLGGYHKKIYVMGSCAFSIIKSIHQVSSQKLLYC